MLGLKKNIAAAGGGSGFDWRRLRPSMKVMEIINAIEVKYGITFSRDFFGTTEFDELYMWLNADLEGDPIGNLERRIEFNETDGPWMNTTTSVATYTPISDQSRSDKIEMVLQFDPEVGFEDVGYTLAIRDIDSGETLAERLISGRDGSVSLITSFPRNAGNTSLVTDLNVEFLIRSQQSLDYTARLTSRYIEEGNYIPPIERSNSGTTPIESPAGVVIKRLLPEMEITEFFKGIVQMFKLIVIGTSDKEFYVNTLDAFYRTGNRHEITKYVDFNTTLTVELPFETIVYERLTDPSGTVPAGTQGGDADTSIQIGSAIDIAYEPVFTKPHLHYAAQIPLFDNPIKYIDGASNSINAPIWMPFSHSGVFNPTYSLGFESEISTYTNEPLNNTLYSNHYKNYLEAIFNVKRRTFKVSAQLPIQIITRLQLNDIITIDQLDYRINNFKYNLLTGRTQLELINGFDKYETNDVILPTDCFVSTNLGGQYRFNIPNIEDYTITSSVVGGGTAFVTDTVTRNQLILDVDAWTNIPTNQFSRTTNLVFSSIADDINIIKNGSFTEGTNGSRFWYANPSGSFTFNNGFGSNDGFAQGTGVNGAGLYQALDAPLVVGCEYYVSYEISDYESGWIDCYLGGSSRTQTVSSNGFKNQYVTATVASNTISFQSIEIGSFVGRIRNVSIIGCGDKYEGEMCVTQENRGATPPDNNES